MSNDVTNDYEDILEHCLQHILTDKHTVEQCLHAYPQHARSLKQDLGIALLASRLDAPRMSNTQVDSLEAHLRHTMSEAHENTSAPLKTPKNVIPFGIPRALSRTAAVILVVIIVVFAGSAGTVAASSDSMPGETLYPVKRLWESIIIVLATVTGNLDDVWIQLAETRLLEAQNEYMEGELSESLLSELYDATDKAIQHAGGSTELQVYLVVLADSLENNAITIDGDSTHNEIIELITPVLGTIESFDTLDADATFATPIESTQIIELSPTMTLTLTLSPTPTEDSLTLTPENLVGTAPVEALIVDASHTPTHTATSRIPATPTRTPTPTVTMTETTSPMMMPSTTFTPLPPPTFGTPPTAQVGAPDVLPSPTFNAGTPTPFPTWYPYPRLTQEAFYLTRTAEWQGNDGGG